MITRIWRKKSAKGKPKQFKRTLHCASMREAIDHAPCRALVGGKVYTINAMGVVSNA